MSQQPLRVGFMMDQIAGHVTNYRNMRTIIDADPSIEATWFEIEFYRPNGWLERGAQWARIVPQYVSGVGRGGLELHRALRRGPFDVIYTNSSVASLFSRQFRQTPTLLHLDSTPKQIDEMPSYPGPVDSSLVSSIKKSVSTRLFTSVAAIQAWSTWAADSFVDDYGVNPLRVSVNPPGIDTRRWARTAGEPDSASPMRVLFVGGDFRRKGGDLVLDWWRRAPIGSVQLDVVTQDDIDEEPGLTVHRNFEPNSPGLLELFHRCDVFALPSLGECFGIAAVEAIAAGLAAVVSDVGGFGDIVDDGHSGFIVRAGDQPSLDAAMDRLLGDPPLRTSMGLVGADRAMACFDVRTTAAAIVDGLHRIARPSR